MICSFRSLANPKIKDLVRDILPEYTRQIDWAFGLDNSTWVAMNKNLKYSLLLACSGLAVKHPRVTGYENRIAFEFNFMKDAPNVDQVYCDSEYGEMMDENPNMVRFIDLKGMQILFNEYLHGKEYGFYRRMLNFWHAAGEESFDNLFSPVLRLLSTFW